MRIADILAEQAREGVIVDLTPPEADLSSYTWLPSRPAPAAKPPEVAVLLHALPGVKLDAPAEAPRVVHVVFFERVEALAEQGLLEEAARRGWEIASTHVTQHKVFRYAAVLRKEEPGDEKNRLRLVNGYRYDKLLLRIREADVERLQERMRRAEHEIGQLKGGIDGLNQELARGREERAALATDLEEARAALGGLRGRLVEAQTERDLTRRRLKSARRSLSFRIGRATRVALRDSGMNLLALPLRWVQTFRGRDELVDE